MKFNSKIIPLLAFVFLLSIPKLSAQGGNSPYSALGIGDLMQPGNIVHAGMGGAGVSYASPAFSNLINPALLSANNITFFDIGVTTDLRTIRDNSASQRDFGGQMMFAAMGFPITRSWTTAVGLRPLSIVNYESGFSELITGTQTFAQYEYTGDGGINQVHWSNGLELFKGMSIGLEIAYNFGAINRQVRATLDDQTNNEINVFFDRTNISDFSFKPAVNYTATFGEEFFVSIGAVYLLGTDFNATSFKALQRRSLSDLPFFSDTLEVDLPGTVTMPASLAVGFSFGKPFKYTIIGDVTTESWGDFRDLNDNAPLVNGRNIRFGGDWTPDITSVSSYFKRATYRAGLFYNQLPFAINNQQAQEFGLTAGFSLPMARGLSSVNMAFVYGRRAFNLEGQISEEYFKFKVGFTVNDRMWFVRRRIN